jgi:RNA polymerase sigma-70 factor, ECF subfamily
MLEAEPNWIELLRSNDSVEQGEALRSLHQILLKGLGVALRQHASLCDGDLQDFSQEALLKIMEKLDQFTGRSRFTTWAQSIAVNHAFSRLRRRHWRDVSLENMMERGELFAEPSVLPKSSLGDDEDQKRLVEALRKAISEDLTPRQRAGIMAELDGMRVDQISELLGINRNALYKLLHDARKSLKHHLEKAGVEARSIDLAFQA